MKDPDLLYSFDLWSYLKKSALYTLRSPLLYPVELMRMAVARGASQIRIHIGKEKFEIYDNGPGIDTQELMKIKEVMDNNTAFKVRRSHINDLRAGQATGNLALFAPGFKSITIENRNISGKIRLTIRNSETELSDQTDLAAGTKIIIHRHSSNTAEEIEILKSSSRWAKTDIILNGKAIGKELTIPGTLVSMKMLNAEKEFLGYCGIPETDEMCRIWFMKDQIVTGKKVIPPYRGFIFYAAVETEDESDFEISKLIPGVKRLYRYIANNYHSVSFEQKKRIEQLLFFHFRESGEREFIDLFSPFMLCFSKEKISYSDVEKIGEKRIIYAVRTADSGRVRAGKSSPEVLRLSPLQSDFLINRMGMKVVFIDPHKQRPELKIRIRMFMNNMRDMFLLNLSSIPGRSVDPELLWKEEIGMLNILNGYLNGEGRGVISRFGFDSAEVKISKGLAFYPLYFKKGEGGLIKKKIYIHLMRNSLIVKKAAKMIESDESNYNLMKRMILLELKRAFS